MSFISPVEGIGIAAFVLMIIGLSLLPKIFFLLTLHRTFDEISLKNRRMQSGEVWLLLIPIFDMIWIFFVVQKMAESLEVEFKDRNIECGELKPSYNIGLTYAILKACTVIPFLGILTSLGTLITLIIYWIKIADYKNLMIRNRA